MKIIIVEQNVDDADNFPADIGSGFPGDNDDGEEEKTIPWRNVVRNTWLMITWMNIIDAVNGKSRIV